MANATRYFELARTEEKFGNAGAALLLYLSSFCDSFNSGVTDYPCGTVAKIRILQDQLGLSDIQLLDLVYSYGPLSDAECQKLLTYSIHGYIAGVKAILSGCAYGY